MKKPEEKRTQVWRRNFNASFMDPHGNIMVAKVIAVAGQIMLLYYTARFFDRMIDKPESLLICLSLVILPDLARKIVNAKYPGANGATK